MNDDSIATHMHCHVLSVLLTGTGKKKKKKEYTFLPSKRRLRVAQARLNILRRPKSFVYQSVKLIK